MHVFVTRLTATILLGLGTVFYLSHFVALAHPASSPLLYFADTFALGYFAATSGAAMTGLGLALCFLGPDGIPRMQVLASTAAAFAMLSIMRLAAMLYGVEEFAPFALVLWSEVIGFGVIALILHHFAMGTPGFLARFMDGYRSLRAAPGAVQAWIWLGLLPANMGSLFFLDHPIGLAVIIGFIYVCVMNLGLVTLERGISRATSIAHVVPWLPLQIFVGAYLFGGLSPALEPGTALYVYAWAFFVINGISVVFDVIDSFRWLAGDRTPMGHDPAPVA